MKLQTVIASAKQMHSICSLSFKSKQIYDLLCAKQSMQNWIAASDLPVFLAMTRQKGN
ncbi:MAG: hypothetical protein KDI11_01370 [Alphaproteobacteria bacterium]|nr:hypothetical protein [Alphaproteobacteria bacterium]